MPANSEISPPVLMLAGPTGIGKTALAVELARRFPLEIVSADSMQVYRGMEIGTAQPTADERAAARFHLCGLLDPAENFNVHRFVELCAAAHREILARGRTPLYVGGSGLYLRALRWGLLPGAERNAALRASLEAEIARLGPEALHDRLAQSDPLAAARIAPTDPIRIVRALEVLETTGRPISEQQNQWQNPAPRFPHELIVLDLKREMLHQRIERRTRAMLDAGWIEETRALLDRGIPTDAHCFKALGYREIVDHLDGAIDRAALAERIAARTRQFARRQMTWLRREQPARWIALNADAAEAHEPLANLLAMPRKLSL